MKRMVMAVVLGLLVAGVGWWLVLGVGSGDLLSPLGRRVGIIHRQTDLEVMGFLPTWMMGKTKDYCEEITHLVFLGIEVEADGSLVWDVQSKKIDGTNYRLLAERFKRCGGKNILGIKLFDDEKMLELLANGQAQQRLVYEIREIIKDFDGVNIDFEYMSDPQKVLGEEFVGLVKLFSESDLGEISVDVFANTVIKGSRVGLESLLSVADRLVVMGYDFHRSGSQYAGAVAPIGSPVGERNITEVIRRIVELGLERKKIIMAYPLYGYEWLTVDEVYGSKVEDYVGMWSLRRVDSEKLKIESYEDFKENWDEVSLTPWMSWMEGVGKKRHQVYFENEKSLKLKIDLVKQTGLVGTGFWALGYESDGLLKDIFRN